MGEYQNKRTTQKTLPPQVDRRDVLKEYFKGIYNRFINEKLCNKPDLSTDRVKCFFESRSIENRFDDFLDSNTDWYLNLINECETLNAALFSSKRSAFLDLGCGKAQLLSWLLKKNINIGKYYGIDLNELSIKKCKKKYQDSRFHFIDGDAKDLLTELNFNFDFVFCINIFPYVLKLQPILKSLRLRTNGKNSFVVVIDPIPSPYWERKFGGMTIALRTPKELSKTLMEEGYKLVDQQSIFTLKFSNLHFFPITNLSVWRTD